MPRVDLSIKGGFDHQVDEYASPATRHVKNLMVDPDGTNRSRPGLRAFATPTPSSDGNVSTAVTGTSKTNVSAVVAYRKRLVGIDDNRRAYASKSDGTTVDATELALPGKDPPRFLIDDDGRMLILGGSEPRAMGPEYRMGKFLSAGSFIPQATDAAIVDRFLLLNDRASDRVFYAGVADHTTFDEGDDIRAGTRSDKVKAMSVLRNQLYLFGEESVEVWYGTGLGDEPFRLEVGLRSDLGPRRSVIAATNRLWWIDTARRVVRLDQHQPGYIHAPIERMLEEFDSIDDAVAQEVRIGGRNFIAFEFEAAGTTLLFDYDLEHWLEWQLWDGVKWSSFPLHAYAFHPGWNRHFVGRSTGAVQELHPLTYTDMGDPLRRVRRLAFIDHGSPTRRKAAHKYQFVLAGGVAQDYETDEQSGAPELEVTYRDENRRWGRARRLPIGRIGDNLTCRPLQFTGSYRRRQLEIACSAPIPFSVARIEEEFKLRDEGED